MSEIELKFLLDTVKPEEIWARLKASDLVSEAPKTVVLRSVYFDTPEHALKQAGFALRLRREGRRWIQTVKAGTGLHAGLSDVAEVENPAPGGRLCLEAIPDAAIRDELIGRIDGEPLQPVCETAIRRTTSELVLSGTRAELAVDAGEIRAGAYSASLSEMEIELLAGSPAALYDIAQLLLPEGALRFSRLSKAARGYLLAEQGRIETPLVPRNAAIIPVDPQETAEQAARNALRECFDQIAANVLVVRQLDDAEGPHQLRVGLRRLRSVLLVYHSVLFSPEMERLRVEARWLGQEVGSLRDLDVVASDLVRPAADAHGDEPGLAALAAMLTRQAGDRRDQLRKLLAGARVQAFLIDLARFIETRGWLLPQDIGQTSRLAEPVTALARQALDRRWKKVSKRARRLEALTEEQRHDLRKELKKLRYAVEFFSPLFATRRIAPFLKRLKKLQTVFGDLNDAVMLKTMFKATAMADAEDRGLQRAIGWMIGASEVRAELSWSHARALWQKLETTRPFWK